MRSVLITRPQPVADEFAQKLRQEGYTAYVAPMMVYVGVTADVSDLASYQALIFTSAQAVQVFAGFSAERSQAVLAVGDATAATATKAGFTAVHSAKGNSSDVAALIKAESAALGLKKVLHLCSADTADDIGTAVAKTGVEVVRRIVYKAELAKDIPEDVVVALQRGAIDTVMLFSARTAENFVKLLVSKGLQKNSPKLEVICLSNAVARALRELPWRAVCVATQPRLEAVMQLLHEQDKSQDRRHRQDRRQKAAKRDQHGHVDSDAYAGSERRIGSRRMHENMQRQRIRHEKMKFINRSVLTFSFMFIAIVLAGVFLMAPEYAQLNHKTANVTRMNSSATGGLMSRIARWFHGSSQPAAEIADQLASSATELVVNPGSADFSQVLSNVMALRKQEGGDTEVSEAIDRLTSLLSSPDVRSPEDVDRVVNTARSNDKTLDHLFGNLKGNDIEAGAILLALNEFRSDISGNRPYADDLTLLKKLTGNDPRMNRALEHLAPYAQSGVMNRQALQTELKGLAGDIVTAQLQGQDVSVQDAAKKRLARLEQAGNVSNIKGETPDAIVARAQVMLDKGDVKGAMRELEKLNGPSAAVAKPWMDSATDNVIADQSSDELTEGVLQEVSGTNGTSISTLINMVKDSIGRPSVPYISPSMQGGNGGADVIAPQ